MQMSKFLAAAAAALAAASACAGHFNGGRTVPIHKLAPVDRDGDKVSVAEALPAAASLAKTCAQCHETEQMKGGSHFRTGLDTNDAPVACNFEPWFHVATNGVVTPLSLTGLPGTKSPSEIGLTAWMFTKYFGRAFPGGGIGDDPRAMEEEGGDNSRWMVTGPLEANCLACHQQSPYDVSEWAKQVLRENWRGAALAAAGLAEVGGMNERLGPTWDPSVMRENPDDHLFRVPEKISYDKGKFDSKGRCVFDVGRPKNENCLACHAVAQAGVPSHDLADDVHLARGMKCVDCHSNGMDHRIKTKTCRDCHVSDQGEGPKPKHAGIPLVHFEKLKCSTCHAGCTKDGAVAQVRTARANRIGIYGKAQWATDEPFVEEPFFRRGGNGKVGIYRRATFWDGAKTNQLYWAFAHNVKPARQARGALPEKCGDCHTWRNPFFAGWEDECYFSLFGGAFAMRPLLKVVMWTIFGLLCLFAAAAAAAFLNRFTGWMHKPGANAFWRFFRGFVIFGVVCCALFLGATGVYGWATGGMTGWVIMLHMCAGGAFAGAVAVLMFFRGDDSRDCFAKGALRLLFIVLAAGVVFTAVMPMMTVFGAQGQAFLLWAHRLVALAFVGTCALACAVARRGRRR